MESEFSVPSSNPTCRAPISARDSPARLSEPVISQFVPAEVSEVVGSVSGGCVEGAVYELSREVLQTGAPVLQTFGVSDDDAFAVGLTCGGIIDIFVEPVSQARFPELGEIAATVQRGEPVAVATVIAGPGQIGARRVVWAEASGNGGHGGASGSLGSGRLDAAADDDARGMLAQGLTGVRRYGELLDLRLPDGHGLALAATFFPSRPASTASASTLWSVAWMYLIVLALRPFRLSVLCASWP